MVARFFKPSASRRGLAGSEGVAPGVAEGVVGDVVAAGDDGDAGPSFEGAADPSLEL